MATVGRLHSRLFEADAAGIWRTPAGDQQMRSFQKEVTSVARAEEPDRFAGVAFDAGDFRVRHDVDALVPAHFFKPLRDIFVFAVSEAAIAVDQRHLSTETAEGLRKFEPDIPSPQNQEMFRDVIEFQRLDVRKRLRLDQSRNRLKRGARARIDDNIFATESAGPAGGQLGFDGLGTNEASCAHHQFRAALLVVIEVNVDQAPHHLALSLAHGSHVDLNVLFADSELGAAVKERGSLGAVDDILARQARDVWARAAHIFSLDHHYALSLLSGGPGNKFTAGTAAEDDEIIFFRIGVQHT